MVRLRKVSEAGLLLGLMFLAFAAKAGEIREEDLEIGDAFTQIERLHGLAGELRGKKRSSQKIPSRQELSKPPAQSSIFADEPLHPVETKPLVPGNKFNPRVLGTIAKPSGEFSWAKPDPKRDGVVGDAKVQFGSRKDISLATIAQNNAAAADAIAAAGAPDTDFVNPDLEQAPELPAEKTFEEKLEELSEKEAPFSLQDYVEFRGFVKENEERLWQLPNRDSRFHENLKTLYKKFGGKDASPSASAPVRRILGVDPSDVVKNGQSKKPSRPASRTH